jgi:beta-lactamase regulating signal transducer with metallopeptidase domain
MWVYTLLPQILNMSVTASIVIVLVMVTRLLLKRAPKIFSYALWAVALFRLVCPVSFSSQFSLIGLFPSSTLTVNDSAYSSITYIPTDIVHAEFPQVALPLPGVSEALNNILPHGEEQLAADPLEFPMAAATMVWLFGIGGMLVYSAISLLQLRRKLVGAVRLRDNIYLADHTVTPFVIGVFRPKIYLPSALREEDQRYVILHEQTHIRRLDHLVKILGFLALAVHWFNPLVWVAFISAVKDMEMSCDERVLRLMGSDIKGEYSTLLLSLTTGRRLINGSPLAFGEGNIKGRIQNIMNFKKPAAWVAIISVLIVAALSIGLAVNKSSVTLNAANIAEAILTADEDGWFSLVKGKPYKLNDNDIRFIIEFVNKSSKKPIMDEYKPTYGGPYETYCTIRIAMAGANGVSDGTYTLQFYHHDNWSIIHGESEYRLALVDTYGDKTWQLSYDACYQFKGWLEQYGNRSNSPEDNTDLGEFEKGNNLVAFVDDTLSESEARALQSRIEQAPNVEYTSFVTGEEAFKAFNAKYTDKSLFEDIDPSVLRHRFYVYISDSSMSEQTAIELSRIPGIAKVSGVFSGYEESVTGY